MLGCDNGKSCKGDTEDTVGAVAAQIAVFNAEIAMIDAVEGALRVALAVEAHASLVCSPVAAVCCASACPHTRVDPYHGRTLTVCRTVVATLTTKLAILNVEVPSSYWRAARGGLEA